MSVTLDTEYLFLCLLLVVGTCWILFIFSCWKHYQSQQQINDENIYSSQLYVYSNAGMLSSIITMTLFLIILYPSLTTLSIIYFFGHIFAEVPRGFIVLYETILFESTFHDKYPKRYFVRIYYITYILMSLLIIFDALVLLLHTENNQIHLMFVTAHIITHILLFLLNILISALLCHNIILLFREPKLPTIAKLLIFAITSITIILAVFMILHLIHIHENIPTIIITICESAFIFMVPFFNSNYRYRKTSTYIEASLKAPNDYQYKSKSRNNSSSQTSNQYQSSKEYYHDHLSHSAEKDRSAAVYIKNVNTCINRKEQAHQPVVVKRLHKFLNTMSTNEKDNGETKYRNINQQIEEPSDEYYESKDIYVCDDDGEGIVINVNKQCNVHSSTSKLSAKINDKIELVVGNRNISNVYIPVKMDQESDNNVDGVHYEASISSFDKDNELFDNRIIQSIAFNNQNTLQRSNNISINGASSMASGNNNGDS